LESITLSGVAVVVLVAVAAILAVLHVLVVLAVYFSNSYQVVVNGATVVGGAGMLAIASVVAVYGTSFLVVKGNLYSSHPFLADSSPKLTVLVMEHVIYDPLATEVWEEDVRLERFNSVHFHRVELHIHFREFFNIFVILIGSSFFSCTSKVYLKRE
jgi:hypothetical protein